jgi:hypothetical protein
MAVTFLIVIMHSDFIMFSLNLLWRTVATCPRLSGQAVQFILFSVVNPAQAQAVTPSFSQFYPYSRQACLNLFNPALPQIIGDCDGLTLNIHLFDAHQQPEFLADFFTLGGRQRLVESEFPAFEGFSLACFVRTFADIQ